MIDPFGSTILGMRAATVALDVALKVTALMALVFAGHAVLGRRRALARSALWNACLVGLLLLPAASLAFPRLRITLPAARIEATARVIPEDVSARPEETLPVGAVATAPEPVGRPERHATAPEPVAPGPAAPADSGPRLGGVDIALGIYLAVAAWLGIRLIASMAAVGGLRRRCRSVDDARWAESLDRWRARLGVSRSVAILTTERVSIPIVVGWLRPAIILPGALVEDTANPALIDPVLLHELGHIRRGDFGWNLVRKLVQLAYWPHPLVWLAGRVIGAVREQACDDICVHELGGAEAYRALLLEVASGLVRRPEPALGLAMARATNLGRRLDWIDRTRGASRCLLRWPARLAIAAGIMTAAGVLGAVELARAAAKPAEQSERPAAASTAPRTIDVIVRARDTGKPIEGARIRYLIDMEHTLRTTDRDGRVRIPLFRHRDRDSLSFDVWSEGYVQQRYFFSQHDARYPKIPEQFSVELFPGEQTLGGTVNDEQGRPIKGVKVEIWGYLGEKKQKDELAFMVDATTDDRGRWRCRCFRSMTFAYLYLSHPDFLADDSAHPRRHGLPTRDIPAAPDDRPLQALRDFSDVQVVSRGVEVAGEIQDARGKPIDGAEVGWLEADRQDTFHHDLPTTTTDAQGRFRFPHARPGRLVLQVKAGGFAPELTHVAAQARTEPVTIRLQPARRMEGRVTDTKGNPIAEAFVVVDTWRTYRSLGVFLWTDADGRFLWADAPADEVLINATHTGFEYASRRKATAGQDVLIKLRRSMAISGRVRDAATNKAVDQARVEVGVPDPKTGRFRWGDRPTVFAIQGRLQADVGVEETPEFRLRLTARGYEPFESRTFRSDERQVEYDVAMKKSDRPQGVPVAGTVLRPDGTPLAGADVAIAYPLTGGPNRLPSVHITNGRLRPDASPTMTTPTARTDAQGRFSLTREPDPGGRYFAVVVVHPECCAEVGRAAFEADPTIRAKPWGRVEGVARIGGKPAAGAAIRYFADRLGNPDVPRVSDEGETKADAIGRFVLERILPGDVRVARSFGDAADFRGWSNGVLLEVKPGETARAEVGGLGRPVIATIAIPPGFDPKADYVAYSEFEIESPRPPIAHAKEAANTKNWSATEWANRWWASPEGHEYRRHYYRFRQAKLRPDGTIRAEDIPSGDYVLRLYLRADPVRGPAAPGRTASVSRRFTIPEIPGGRSDEPFDLGVLKPEPR